MSIINTNVMSLNSQRNLATNNASLSTTIQRLSSGLRINSAKDDAAGLAISERFTSQIRGLNQAARNANDGISLAQTAEGALAEVGNNVQRIRELAVQASNGTNSQADRDALNVEVTQLKTEIQRVADQTKFNGVELLNGSFVNTAFQVGADAGQTININASQMANVSTASLGGTVNRYTTSALTSAITDFDAIAAGDFQINGTSVGAISAAANAQERAGQMAEAINRVSTTTGVSASYDAVSGSLTLSSKATFAITGAAAADTAGVSSASVVNNASATGLNSVDVAGFSNAQMTIDMADAALKQINTSRANLGAIQNRFSSVISSLNTTSENLSASRSRIRDTDFAKETAELARTQILVQAGTAMLAQSNQAPQNVLSLLR